jgi:hypothetical protein
VLLKPVAPAMNVAKAALKARKVPVDIPDFHTRLRGLHYLQNRLHPENLFPFRVQNIRKVSQGLFFMGLLWFLDICEARNRVDFHKFMLAC